MNLPSCKVSVHFVEIKDKDENGEDYEIIEGSEVEVLRDVRHELGLLEGPWEARRS